MKTDAAEAEPARAQQPLTRAEGPADAPAPRLDTSNLAKILKELQRTCTPETEPSELRLLTGVPAANAQDIHMNIVQASVSLNRAAAAPARLGPAGQQSRRELEQVVRLRAVDFAHRLVELGHSQSEAAQRLGLHERTLRQWDADARQGAPRVLPRGRPLLQANPEQCQAVFSCLHEVGPGIGLPALRTRFGSLARAELDDLLKFYRRLWRTQNTRRLHVLHWQQPGSVWAMDFAQAPCPIDGLYPYLLAVRDLASGQQLLWLPVTAQTAAVVIAELRWLLAQHGAPLVLKTDNGSAFIADTLQWFLRAARVHPLFSPPRTPSYNGSIEAAIGSLKTRTQRQAEHAGHADIWASADVAAARTEANTTARPRRLHGATPAVTWAARPVITENDRQGFQATVCRFQEDARRDRGLPSTGLLSHNQQAAVDRVALQRALVAHDLLLFTRRRIPPPIQRPKVTAEG